jgi:hypothetical protein
MRERVDIIIISNSMSESDDGPINKHDSIIISNSLSESDDGTINKHAGACRQHHHQQQLE